MAASPRLALRLAGLQVYSSLLARSPDKAPAAIREGLNGDHPADPFGFHIAAVALLNNRAARHHQIAIR